MKYHTALLFLALPSLGAAGTVTTFGGLDFQTEERQSSWGPGGATRFETTELLTLGVNSDISVGKIVREATIDVTVPNPALATFLIQNPQCAIITCSGQPPATIKVKQTVPVPDNGAELTASTRGEVGAEVGYLVDGGSVSAELSFAAQAMVPDEGEVEIGETFNFKPMSDWIAGKLDTQSPTAEAFVNAYTDFGIELTGEACLTGVCTNFGGALIEREVNRQEIVGIDPNEVRYLDGFVPGLDLTTSLVNQTATLEVGLQPPLAPEVQLSVTEENEDGSTTTRKIGDPIMVNVTVDVASAEIAFPLATGEGSLDASGDVEVDTRADFLKVRGDVDTLIPLLPPGGLNVGLGPLSATFTGYDLDVGPNLDVFQNFDLTSELFVDLAFSREVDVAGLGSVMSWSGLWNELPDMSVFGTTIFTPTFSAKTMLRNDTGLVLDFDLEILLGQISAGVSVAGVSLLSETLGPLFQDSVDLGDDVASISLFDDTFLLGGLNMVQGQSFAVTPFGALPPGPAPVPLQGGLGLLLSAFGCAAVLRRRKTARA